MKVLDSAVISHLARTWVIWSYCRCLHNLLSAVVAIQTHSASAVPKKASPRTNSGCVSFLTAGLATPVDLKLKLIPILQHMHHDASLASSSRQLLQQLVTSYPSTKMVIVTLHTFTLLAASSLVDIPKQVSLPKACLPLEVQSTFLKHSDSACWSKETVMAVLGWLLLWAVEEEYPENCCCLHIFSLFWFQVTVSNTLYLFYSSWLVFF